MAIPAEALRPSHTENDIRLVVLQPEREVLSTPRSMDTEELGHTVSALSTVESLLTVAHLGTNGPATSETIARRFFPNQPNFESYRAQRRKIESRLNNLVGHGYVDLSSDGTATLTPYADLTAISGSGYLLNLLTQRSMKYNTLWGNLQAYGPDKTLVTPDGIIPFRENTAFDRVRILQEVAKARRDDTLPLRLKDMMDVLGRTMQTTSRHLKGLAQAGVVEYRAANVGNGSYAHFQPLMEEVLREEPSEAPIYPYEPGLSNRVWEYTHDRYFEPSLAAERCLHYLWDVDPEWAIQQDQDILLDRVTKILDFFADNGWLEREDFDKNRKSKIDNPPNRSGTLSSLLTTLYDVRTLEPHRVKEGKRLAGKIVSEPYLVEKVLTNASGWKAADSL